MPVAIEVTKERSTASSMSCGLFRSLISILKLYHPQQTVEKIQQVEGKTTVQTVIVKEEDLVVDAIAKNKSAVFTITKEVQDADGKTIEVSAGSGFVISTPGVVVVDASFVFEKGVYYVTNDSGKFKADFMSSDKQGFSFLKVGGAVNGTDKLVFTVPNFGDISKMKIGQKIIVLGNTISSSIFVGNKNVNINVTKSNAGGLVMDLDGDALGVALTGESTNFVSIDDINSALKVSLSGGVATDTTQPASPILAPSITPTPSITQ